MRVRGGRRGNVGGESRRPGPSRMGIRRGAKGTRSGLTIIELMFALTIMAVGVFAAFSGQVGSIDLLRATRENDAAMLQLRGAMEEVLSRPTGSLTMAFPNGAVMAVPGKDLNPLALDAFEIRVRYPSMVGGVTPDPFEVRLDASWNDFRGRPRSESLSTMVKR
jgi:type II secretory pathway pseudopilin PulG